MRKCGKQSKKSPVKLGNMRDKREKRLQKNEKHCKIAEKKSRKSEQEMNKSGKQLKEKYKIWENVQKSWEKLRKVANWRRKWQTGEGNVQRLEEKKLKRWRKVQKN